MRFRTTDIASVEALSGEKPFQCYLHDHPVNSHPPSNIPRLHPTHLEDVIEGVVVAALYLKHCLPYRLC